MLARQEPVLTVKLFDDGYRVSSRDIAKELGVAHKTSLEQISTYRTEFERLGSLTISSEGKTTFTRADGRKGASPPQKTAWLTEDQSYLLLTFSMNTAQARELKVRLIQEFRRLRDLAANPTPALPLAIPGGTTPAPLALARAILEATENLNYRTEFLEGKAVLLESDIRDTQQAVLEIETNQLAHTRKLEEIEAKQSLIYHNPAMCHAIHHKVHEYARVSGKHWAVIYRMLKEKFKVPRYDRLTEAQFEECIAWLNQLIAEALTRSGKITQPGLA